MSTPPDDRAPDPGRSPLAMPLPEFPGHPHATPVALGLATVANLFAWAESVNIGTIVSFCTVAFPAMVGAAIYALNNLGPALAKFRATLADARSQTLAGKMEALSGKLDEARELHALQERQIALQQKIADDAERLANLNRRLMDRAEAERQAAVSERAQIADELKASRAEVAELLAKIARRTEDANEKLHTLSSPIQAAVQNTQILIQGQDDAAHRLDRNADIARGVDGKADHITAQVDTIAGRSSDEFPPFKDQPPNTERP